MSDVVERTLATLPRLLSSSLLGGRRGEQGGQPKHAYSSSALQAFVRTVDSAHSRSEEAALVQRELSQMKQQMADPSASVKQWCEILPRIVFSSVLGYDVSFADIYAIKLAAQGKGYAKRLGYMAVTLLLDADKEIAIMIMGTLQRDLHSSNILDNHMALSAAAVLVSKENIPLMLPPIEKLLRHQQALVRERAVHCIHAFFRLAPSALCHKLPELKGMLGTKDPGVLSAVVTLMAYLVEQNREELASAGTGLLNILQQVQARRFPSAYEYHGVPLPWLQIRLLRTLGVLGSGDDDLASSLLPTLLQTLSQANSKEMISLAIVYECLAAVATLAKERQSSQQGQPSIRRENCAEKIEAAANTSAESDDVGESLYESEQGAGCSGASEARQMSEENVASKRAMLGLQPLLEESSKCVARFLSSGVRNLRYLGIKSLTELASVATELAAHHQAEVVRCLDDPDPIVRRQTLALLHRIANASNVKAICSKMLEHVGGRDRDTSLHSYVAGMVCDLGSRLAPDPAWYLHTTLPLLSLRLEPVQVVPVSDSMLRFFTKAAQDPRHPDFSGQLFARMVSILQESSDDEAGPLLQFALRALRFVPFPAQETKLGEEFLACCSTLLQRPGDVGLKEQVVLCVQELLVRGSLPRPPVHRWAQALQGMLEGATPHQYRLKVGELHRLASLSIDLTSLSVRAAPAPGQIDFTLSFADSYIHQVCRNQRPFFSVQRFPKADLVSLLHVEGSGKSSTPDDSASLEQGSSSLCSGSSPLTTEAWTANSSPGDLHALPGLALVWSKQGFADAAAMAESTPPANRVGVSKETEEEEKESRRREELAEALFEGLPPPAPLSYSQVTLATDASPMSPASPPSLFGPDPYTSGPTSPLAASQTDQSPPWRNSCASGGEASLGEGLEPQSGSEDMDSSWSALSEGDSNSWKTLHAALRDVPQATKAREAEAEADRASSVTVTADRHLLSDLGSSEGNLSISDDSLENIRDLSLQNSPAKLMDLPQGDSGNRTALDVDNGSQSEAFADQHGGLYDQYIEEQIADYEKSRTTAEWGDEGEVLYAAMAGNAASGLYSGLEDDIATGGLCGATADSSVSGGLYSAVGDDVASGGLYGRIADDVASAGLYRQRERAADSLSPGFTYLDPYVDSADREEDTDLEQSEWGEVNQQP